MPPKPQATPRSSTHFQLQPKGARTKHRGYLAGSTLENAGVASYLSGIRGRQSIHGLPSSRRPTSSRDMASCGDAAGAQTDPDFSPVISNARTLSVQLQSTNLYQTTETRRFTKEQIEQGLHQGYARMDDGRVSQNSWTSSSDDKDRSLSQRPATEPAPTAITRSNEVRRLVIYLILVIYRLPSCSNRPVIVIMRHTMSSNPLALYYRMCIASDHEI